MNHKCMWKDHHKKDGQICLKYLSKVKNCFSCPGLLLVNLD